MKFFLKRLLKGAFVLLLLLVGAAGVLGLIGSRKLNNARDLQPPALTIPNDTTAVVAGQKWATSLCTGCHGENYAGKSFMESPAIGTVWAPNLTAAGIGKNYTDADWVRAIRYGLRNTGQPFVIMPSENFQYLSDVHLGELIAYLKTLPTVEKECPERNLTFLGSVMYQLGAFGELPADKVDITLQHRTAPEKAENLAYGQYLATLYACSMCHGSNFKGGKSPDIAAPPCPDISASSAVGQWSAEDFLKTMRSGQTPSGKQLNPKFMPWQEHGRLDDIQLNAIRKFITAQSSE